MQTQKVEQDHRVSLPNNPFIKSDTCFINNIPPELLSRIFEIGAIDEDSEDEDAANCVDKLSHLHLDGNDADRCNAVDGKMEEKKSDDVDNEEAENGDEEETDNEGDSEADGTGSSDFSYTPFQILVSHVCHHWRHVALSTPSLWTTIGAGPDDRQPYEHVSAMLERSKSLPLDIYVDCEPREPESEDDDIVDSPPEADVKFLYSLLIPHIHRWRTVEVTVFEYRYMYIFLTAVSDSSIPSAPQLEKLALYHHDDTEDYDRLRDCGTSKHPVLFGGSAPCLTSIILWGVHVDWNQPWIASASKLVELELAFHSENARPSWTQFRTILYGTPALEKLSLRQSGPSGDPSQWLIEWTPESRSDLNTPIQLPKVTDFIFAFHTPEHAIGLLRKLCLPTLKNLVLDFEDGDYTEFVDVLVGPATSLSRSSTKEQPRSLLNNLDRLKIAGLPCSKRIDGLYGELDNLTLLNLSLSYLPETFLSMLSMPRTVAGRPSVWLPQLKTLYVSGTSSELLRQVIQKRVEMWPEMPSIQALYMEESCDMAPEDVEWFEENLVTFGTFNDSDDEDADEDEGDTDFDDLVEDVDEWSDMD